MQNEHFEILWCCLDCRWKGKVGEMFMGKSVDGSFACPSCRSERTARADGATRVLDEYFGEIGTKQ